MDFLVSTSDDVVGRDLFRSGSFDVSPMRAILGELRERSPDTCTWRVFLDVGANSSTTSVAAITWFGLESVIAVEPDPENFRLHELNLRLNDLTERSCAHRVALSNSEGELRLLRRGTTPAIIGWSSPPPSRDSNADVVAVPATTLDALLRNTGTDPSDIALVWMDVQGHDGQVLAESGSLLDAGTPMVVEFWPDALRGANGLEQLIAICARAIHDGDRLGRAVRAAPRSCTGAGRTGRRAVGGSLRRRAVRRPHPAPVRRSRG